MNADVVNNDRMMLQDRTCSINETLEEGYCCVLCGMGVFTGGATMHFSSWPGSAVKKALPFPQAAMHSSFWARKSMSKCFLYIFTS